MFVVGAGRSGTSALTRVLGLCGGALPLETLDANFGNPAGYWEPRAAVEINDRYLGARGSSWYDESLDLQLAADPLVDAEALIEDAAALLRTGFERNGPIVIKDPRISGLLPAWLEAASRAGLRPAAVHVFRSPNDVAASLARRDGLAAERSHALWFKYNLIAERDARPIRRAFVSYEGLMVDWRSVVEGCASRIGIELPKLSDAEHAVTAFLSPDLHHHALGSQTPIRGYPLLERLYELLGRAERDDIDCGAFDAILARYVEGRRLPAASLLVTDRTVPSNRLPEA